MEGHCSQFYPQNVCRNRRQAALKLNTKSCHIFKLYGFYVSNQGLAIVLTLLLTILSTDSVCNLGIRRAIKQTIIASGSGFPRCLDFGQWQKAYVIHRLRHMYACLRTILSTRTVQNPTCRSAGNKLHCRGCLIRLSTYSGVCFARHYSSCRLAYLAVVDRLRRRPGADY